ncbi:MAG: response regulator receiver protein [Caulobacter sp.]|nr:response regulator receiver protein [Caulobacter sp.]
MDAALPDPLEGLCVMVVDDHHSTRRLVADVLRAGGVDRVVTAESGSEALGMMAGTRPDVIITDWLMPVMDGLAFTRAVRHAAITEDPRIPDPRLPIIMLTTERTRRDVEIARAAGADAFLVKPFTPARVLERVATVRQREIDFVISTGYVGPDRRQNRDDDMGYAGPLRRRGDGTHQVDIAARALLCAQIIDEMATFQRLIEGRGGLDHMLRQMACRVMHALRQRASEAGDRVLTRAAASLARYVSAVGGAGKADPEVVQIHLDTLRSLAGLAVGDLKGSAHVTRQLDRAVSLRIESHLSGLTLDYGPVTAPGKRLAVLDI